MPEKFQGVTPESPGSRVRVTVLNAWSIENPIFFPAAAFGHNCET